KFSEMIASGSRWYVSDQVKSRPAINRMPRVEKYPGETNLKRRRGGTCPAVSWSCAKTGSVQPWSSIGMELAIATEVKPGIAAILSWIAFCMWMRASGSFTSVLGNDTLNVCNSLGDEKPGSMLINARNVRIIRPAQMSSTDAKPTWTTTRVFL